jgi:hypothetical protein
MVLEIDNIVDHTPTSAAPRPRTAAGGCRASLEFRDSASTASATSRPPNSRWRRRFGEAERSSS